MPPARKDRIRALLKSIETGEPGPIAVVDESKYIQHNPQTQEGSEGLASLFARLSKTRPRVNMVRAFEDGDFVFAHMEYDFSSRKIGFEVFRFEGDPDTGRAVEHWDNIQERRGPNASGRSMVDGPTVAEDHSRTEENRAVVQAFLSRVLIEGRVDELSDYIAADGFAEHNPALSDGIESFTAALRHIHVGERRINYHRVHRILAEGNFVLGVCEGRLGGVHSAFYDLFRLADGMIVEHWDTTEKIVPREQWKNNNGKF